MQLFVDSFRKITVSLGGVCTLGCKHCYTNTRHFRHQKERSINSLVDDLHRIGSPQFDTICVSGDTDPLLNERDGLQLIKALTEEFVSQSIMFTTRLVPSTDGVGYLAKLASVARDRRQLLIPCISVATYSYPNRIEIPEKVPPTIARLEFMRLLAAMGLPCILTIRPTFPFSLVPKTEVMQLVRASVTDATIALGEIFLLDQGGEIEHRLGLPQRKEEDFFGKMTFLDQPSIWRKRYYPDEVLFARSLCHSMGIPYFLRSPSAVSLLKSNWNFSSAKLENWLPVPEPGGEYLMP
jgi:hypothetical protein